ncbi:hypothetical protein Q3G72_005810 [Acer saccharum]|nr:hypothetical protein Q3G72_005810 [Acer saccharum]
MVESAWRSDLHRRTEEQSVPSLDRMKELSRASELARELHLTEDLLHLMCHNSFHHTTMPNRKLKLIIYFGCAGKAIYKQGLQDKLDELTKEFQSLIELKDEVNQNIKIAEDGQQMKAKKEVADWVSMVEDAVTDVKQLREKVELMIKKHRSRRFLSEKDMLEEKLEDMLRHVISLKREGNFEAVAEMIRPAVAEMIRPKYQINRRVRIEGSTVDKPHGS